MTAARMPARTNILTDPEWPSRGACRDIDPETLFVVGAAQHKAKAICMGCPVRMDCLADALDSRAEFGVWGGMTERERRTLLRRRPDITSWRTFLGNLQRQDQANAAKRPALSSVKSVDKAPAKAAAPTSVPRPAPAPTPAPAPAPVKVEAAPKAVKIVEKKAEKLVEKTVEKVAVAKSRAKATVKAPTKTSRRAS